MYHSMNNNKVTVETCNSVNDNEIDTNIKRTPTDYAFFF